MKFNKTFINNRISRIKRLYPKHKNNKFWYYFLNYFRKLIPASIYRNKLDSKLNSIKLFDEKYVWERVNYYNQVNEPYKVPETAIYLKDFKQKDFYKAYYFDSYEYTRYFPLDCKINPLFFDLDYSPEVPSLVKSRPIEKNSKGVILKLNKARHFLFVNDSKEFEHKKNMLVGRMNVFQKHRIRFLDMYFDNPLCNIGQINTSGNLNYLVNRLTIDEHLNYKFILCIEGNDVATNLKWVMSSNSIAVMPKPKFETWFMDGTLIANHHYIEIKDDYSDLEERLNYYIEHTTEALQIVENANKFAAQFKNKKQEDLISILVLKKYFDKALN